MWECVSLCVWVRVVYVCHCHSVRDMVCVCGVSVWCGVVVVVVVVVVCMCAYVCVCVCVCVWDGEHIMCIHWNCSHPFCTPACNTFRNDIMPSVSKWLMPHDSMDFMSTQSQASLHLCLVSPLRSSFSAIPWHTCVSQYDSCSNCYILHDQP